MNGILRRKEGFTLIELLIVILIIAILVAIALPLYLSSRTNAQRRTCQANLRTIDGQVNAYYAENEAVPADVHALMTGNYLKSDPTCPTGHSTYALVVTGGEAHASCVDAAGHTY